MTPVRDDDRRVAFVAPDHSVTLATLDGHIRHVRGSYAAAGFCRGVDVLLTARSDGMIERRDARTTALLADYDGLRGTPTMLASHRGCGLIAAGRSAERRVGKEGVSKGRFRVSPSHLKTKNIIMFVL